jgi:hypothetical protein
MAQKQSALLKGKIKIGICGKLTEGNSGNYYRRCNNRLFNFRGDRMIITRLKLPLEQAEYSALLKMAGDELRNPIDQARFILRQELERRGLLAETLRAGQQQAQKYEPAEVQDGSPS